MLIPKLSCWSSSCATQTTASGVGKAVSGQCHGSDALTVKVVEKKFLKTLEETVTAKKLDPRARAMLFKAIAVLAYESQVRSF